MRSMSENDAKIVSAKGKQCSEILEAPAPGENSEEIFPESFWLLFLVVRSVGASRCFHALGTHADSVPIFNEVFIAHPEHPIVRIPISPPGTNARELCPQLRILLPFRPLVREIPVPLPAVPPRITHAHHAMKFVFSGFFEFCASYH